MLVGFSVYAVESGGAALWSDTQLVMPSQGLFSVVLGSTANPFPQGLFTTPLFVGVTVDTDSEMTPRVVLTSTAYAQQALDAEKVGGMTAAALDQTAEVTTLQGDVATAQGNVAQLQTDVIGVQTDIATAQGEIGQLQTDVGANQTGITQLQTNLATTAADLMTVEDTLPTLQTQVSGSCASGSSIRSIFANGSVTCEVDDASQWGFFNNNLYYTAGRIGIGTTAPAAAIQIDAPEGVDPFRARVQSSTKLRVHANGSVSVGSSSAGPENGLYVLGDARIGAGSSPARLTVTNTLWHAALDNSDAGGDDWFLGSSATGWAIGAGKFVISPTDISTNAAFVIDSNKDVGIGVNDPLTRLHLGGGSDVSATGGGYLTIGGLTGANLAVDSNEIMARSNGSVATLALNAEGGEVTINSGGTRDSDALEVRGRVYFDNGGNSGMRLTGTTSNPTNALFEPTAYEEGLVGGSVRPFWRMYSREFYAETPLQYKTYSDRSLKNDVRPIADALATINALQGVTYELNKHPMDNRNRQLTEEQEYDRRHQLGFIAQDVEKVLPQLVSEDKFSGLQSVGYMGVIPILVEAMKEQQRQIDSQQELLKSQQAEIAALRRLIE